MCYCGNDDSIGFCSSGVCQGAREKLGEMIDVPTPGRYSLVGGLESGKVIWSGQGGPVTEIAIQRDRVYGRWDAGCLWFLLGYLPLESPKATAQAASAGAAPTKEVGPETYDTWDLDVEGDKGPGGATHKGWCEIFDPPHNKCNCAAPGPSPEGKP